MKALMRWYNSVAFSVNLLTEIFTEKLRGKKGAALNFDLCMTSHVFSAY